MNERIRELAQQAGLARRRFMFGKYYEDDMTAEQKKFAELIIKECAERAETKLLKGLKSNETHQLSYNEGLRDGVAEFKKHFGVE